LPEGDRSWSYNKGFIFYCLQQVLQLVRLLHHPENDVSDTILFLCYRKFTINDQNSVFLWTFLAEAVAQSFGTLSLWVCTRRHSECAVSLSWRNHMFTQHRKTLGHLALAGAVILSSLTALSAVAEEDDVNHKGTFLPSGLLITPTAVPQSAYQPLNPGLSEFPKFVAGGAVSLAKSPDGNTLLVLASGHNSLQDKNGNAFTNEYIFVFDIADGRSIKKQVIQIPNAFVGIAFDPSGQTFYVGGGDDDNVHSFTVQHGKWAESDDPIKLGHGPAAALFSGDYPPVTAGLDLTQDGKTLVIANYNNESITFVDLQTRTVAKDLDLRPGKINPADSGVAGGEYPFWVTVKGNEQPMSQAPVTAKSLWSTFRQSQLRRSSNAFRWLGTRSRQFWIRPAIISM
jgi:WD40 repeat protein